MHDVLIPMVFFTFLAVIIVVPQVLKSRDRAKMYETMKAAYDKGQPLPPEMVAAMSPKRDDVEEAYYAAPAMQASRDLRRGIVWLAVGVGLFVMGAICYAGLYSFGGAIESAMGFGLFGAIPFCIGLAFLALWFFGGGRRR